MNVSPPKESEPGSAGESDSEVEWKRKSPARKDDNHLLRQEQISTYKKKVLKEERQKRSQLRHSKDEDSPRKKKRVSFHEPEKSK